jgi:hypothetical protein
MQRIIHRNPDRQYHIYSHTGISTFFSKSLAFPGDFTDYVFFQNNVQ